ncbi:FAD-dependent oxidoreductase [Rhodopirellula baltica]|uniref:Nitrite reductase [NAD(P)H] large subunit n=1 Tax=Rhodopirellula baltica SWK14 TaxID=993516 RepID=L7CN50_RHOBT|nr:FAD-dependent oxidoreductase [Rhodopirellula baltica]ELP35285.1 nitrite reductase [NAD(P)H] large subunit [Rhodopirellula baltica SWK14]
MQGAPQLAAPSVVDVPSAERLVIVGGGMAAHGFCKRVIGSTQRSRFAISVYGEEPRPAYDRVNLSSLLSGRPESDLLLSPREWYEANDIDLHTGRRITRIDLQRQQIHDDQGGVQSYDHLVLATGSYPWVPPISGSDSPGVFVYRTIDDLEAIQRYVREHGAKTSAVVGGGLLGLEAAKVITDLGLATTILEVAPGLMPRQLDAQAAKVLREKVESLGVDVHVTRRTKAIEPRDGRLTLQFENAEPSQVDIVLVAAGIRPRDELARDAGLELGPRGGIAVNRRLETSDPHVFAIGECAAVDGHIHGLVAPCYRMADVLAARLAGEQTEFVDSEEAVELKLLGVPVITLGKAIGESTSGVVVTHDGENGYRKLILEQGRVVGAASVGEWDDVNLIRMSVAQHKRLWPTQRVRFQRTGMPYAGGTGLQIHQWPGHATVCSCMGVTRHQLGMAIVDGHVTAAQLSAATGAGTACGTCTNLLCELVGEGPEQVNVRGSKVVLVTSVLAACLALALFLTPPLPFATSVQDSWRKIDLFWRDGFIKQVTGFSLLFLMLAALAFSLRKRVKRISFGDYGWWRAAHAAIGTAMLFGLIVHTGVRMGSNLNFVLSLTFMLLALVGGLAGVASSLESKLSGDSAMFMRAWRPKLTWVHIALFVPLPALLAGHVFSVYWY